MSDPAAAKPRPGRSLRLRLVVSFTLVAGAILLAFLPVAYSLIQRRLHLEMDRQLGIDWALVEAHLEQDGSGGIRWRTGSPATPKSAGYAETWFDVWSDAEVLLSHWPAGGTPEQHPPPPTENRGVTIYQGDFTPEFHARILQKTARISEREVSLRVFRDQSGIHATLRQILAGLALGMPVAVLLAALGGYAMAGRTLKPIGEMADQARQITSASLGKRLSNPNPHDELGQLATVFNETLQRLESSFESLKRFTADASHELRTPLTALRSVGEVALRESGDAEAMREAISSMLEEAQRLHDLTDTLLMLARMENDQSPLRCETVILIELMAEVRDSVYILAEEKRQAIRLSGTMELSVNTNRQLLRQAVMNILHNAILYSPPGTEVRMRCFQRGDQAVVEVVDEGPGIAPEHREKVFERFYRIDKARARADGGTGLGLAIASLSVARIGGHLELDSTPRQGSCFRIVLPAQNADSPL